MEIVLTIIALQQGLFAVGWWMAGSFLGLSRRSALHWAAAALGSAVALALILQRGHWPGWLTIVVANVLAMGSFIAVRRGVQIFLHRPTTDREAAVLATLVLASLTAYLLEPRHARVAVLASSTFIAWTLMRCAWEAHRALFQAGDPIAARVVAAPLLLLGLVYAARVGFGIVSPDVAAQPLNQANAFNAGVAVSFMTMGLVLNMVLAYLVANRLVRRLHQRATVDPLTGLLNRRGFAPRLQQEATRLKRHGDRYAVLALDVDHFKSVNDRHGHPVGDGVLAQLGALLRDTARDIDSVARLGGEEFCLLLPHTELVGARQLAERLCRLVREAAWEGVDGPVTVSVGVALASRDDPTPQAVLTRADAALLRAKQTGRDRVVVAAG
jgi:diguanylate cyclase (GGDEF)-like protein